VGYTACPERDPGDPVGAFVAVTLQFNEPLPLTPGEGTPDVTLTAQETGISWRLTAADGAWTVRSDQDTATRAILRNGGITFAIPQADVGSAGLTYRVVSAAGTADGTVGMTGALRTPSGGGGEPTEVEDLDEFLAELSASVAAGDAGFSFERLDPHVLAEFGPAACRAHLSEPVPGFQVFALEDRGVEAWDWPTPDGGTVPIPEARYVFGAVTQDGQTTEAELHFTVLAGKYHWFTYC
jgi:hypothetical protein